MPRGCRVSGYPAANPVILSNPVILYTSNRGTTINTMN
jgi:hypothetical protein